MPFMRRVGRPGLLGTAVRTAVVAGTATAVSGAVGGAVAQRQRERAAEEQHAAMLQQQDMDAAAPAAPAAPAAAPDLVQQLQQLGALRQQGILTDAEFEQAKRQLLGN